MNPCRKVGGHADTFNTKSLQEAAVTPRSPRSRREATVDPVPVMSARTLIPFIDFMRRLGAPVDRWLEQCRLPSRLCEDPNTYISTLKHWAFVSLSAKKEGIDDLGLQVAADRGYEIIGPRVLGGVVSAPTLLCGLEEFARRVPGESSAAEVWLTRHEEKVDLRLKKSLDSCVAGYRQTEWLAIVALIKVVQLFAGKSWQPEVVSMKSSQEAPLLARRIFPDVRFLSGQPHCLITFPGDLLSVGPHPFSRVEVAMLARSSEDLTPGVPPASFSDSLQQLLVPYLRDGYASLEVVADVVGTSRRTLQRRLAESGVSFSTLVDRARFGVASDLLTETDRSSTEIARATGYQDPSHFARAFRRLAGCSPHQYRRAQFDQSVCPDTKP